MGQRNISLEALRRGGITVATPTYCLQTTSTYTVSMINLAQACGKYGIDLYYSTFSSPFLNISRNQLCDIFLQDAKYTHLIFIDSDIGFDAKDVLLLKEMMTEPTDNPYDILGGIYPTKTIDWSVVKQAINSGVNENELDRYTNGRFLIVAKENANAAGMKPIEVKGMATGFMMIKKSALKKFSETYPEYMHMDFELKRKIMQFFHTEINPVTNTYQSEDYWFSEKARQAGLKIWACPWMQLTHTGPYTFKGNMVDTLRLVGSTKQIVD